MFRTRFGGSSDARSDPRAPSDKLTGSMATMLLSLLRKAIVTEQKPHADLPLELMMQIAACMDTDADIRSLRAVNKQWKAAVDESVTRLSANMYTTGNRDIGRLAGYRQLRSLDLSQCRAISDISGLASLPQLECLELNFCMLLSSRQLTVITQLTQLRKLDLSGCSGVTDQCLRAIAGLTHLEWLSLQGCSGVSAGGIYSLQYCRRLQYLDLSGTGVIGLDFLKMHAASHADNDQVKQDGSRGKTRVISVHANCTVSLAVAQLPMHSPPRLSLRRLLLANCNELGGPALASLIGHAELEALDLSHSTHVLTEASIASLQKLKSLRRLTLESSPDLCDSTVLKLTALQGLTHLDISECANVTPGAISSLRQRLPATCAIYSATS